MSRTKRNTKHANIYAQKIATANQRRESLKATDEIIEAGYTPSNRLKSTLSRVPCNWEDKKVAGYYETWDK